MSLKFSELRSWDLTLLERYKPNYYPVNRVCSYCGFGPCNLHKTKELVE